MSLCNEQSLVLHNRDTITVGRIETCDTSTAPTKSFKFLEPKDANNILLTLTKPKLLVDRKQNFTNTYKAFQESFARHCALLSCVDESKRTSITLRTLEVLFEKINMYYKRSIIGSEADNNGSSTGKELYDTYIANLRVICANVKVDNEELWAVICGTSFSYKPKQFIQATRNKYKCGVWETGDDYDSNKLYVVFKDICVSHLNIIQ